MMSGGAVGCGCGVPVGRLGQAAPAPNPMAGFLGIAAILGVMGALYWYAGRKTA